jgi:predicted secreted protein
MPEDAVVRLHVGETYDLALAGHAATGYRWFPTASNAHVTVSNVDDESEAVETSRRGGRVTEHFVIRAVSPGTARVVFDRARPWDRHNVADRHQFEVVVLDS